MLLSRTNLKQNYTKKLKINVKKKEREPKCIRKTQRARIAKLISDYIEFKAFSGTVRFISY